jgi:putative ABC transport system ATP-binding protein
MQIRTENLTKIFFKDKPNEVTAIEDLNLEIGHGKFLAITGPSGSGKTTLLSMLGLLSTPTRGRVVFDNEEVSSYSDGWKTKFRKKNIGIIFQQYNLLPNYLAWENVALPLLCTDASQSARRNAALSLMKKFGLEKRTDFKVAHLSGGEQQRVAIARALITDPQVVIADEPTASVDSETKSAIIETFEALIQSGKTLIVATHDQDLLSHSDQRLELVSKQ